MTHRIFGTCVLVLLCALAPSVATAQSEAHPIDRGRRIAATEFVVSAPGTQISRVREILVDSSAAIALARSASLTIAGFPVDGVASRSIELRQIRSVVDERTRVVVGTRN